MSIACKPDVGQIVACRGGVWRFVRAEGDFWLLELLRQGSHYAEEVIQVWAIPSLEASTLQKLKPSAAFIPLLPSSYKAQKKELYAPFLAVRKNKILMDRRTSKEPQTARQCAIEIKTWQFEPWRRIVEALPFPRLLLSDDVGLGKTTQAAIILTELTRRKRAERVLIIAPQHLCEKWQSELYERFGLAFGVYDRKSRERLSSRGVKNPWQVVEKVIVSRDFVKRWENLKPLQNIKWDCIVIDECHHFVRDKNNATKRLRDLADKIVYNSPALLMLSATPFTGNQEQFNSLVQLLDPKFYFREHLQKWNYDTPYLVRRNKKFLAENAGENFAIRQVQHHVITEGDLCKDEREVVQLVDAELSAAVCRADSQVWDRLLEEVAKKRLSSSWAAFSDTISGDKGLRAWFSEATKAKVKHLCDNFISAKLQVLSEILAENVAKTSKVVIFTEAIKTMQLIKGYLLDKKIFRKTQVATLDGSTVKDKRMDIEERFADPSDDLRILIATDTISEGKDLQHTCYHLVHFELPWSLVKMEQRNGRIDRLGQKHTPYIHNIIYDTKITPDQKILSRLQDKIKQAADNIGSVNQIVETIGELSYKQLQNEEKLQEELANKIATVTKNSEKTGFSLAKFTAQSNAPLVESGEYKRVQQLNTMLQILHGSLKPNGKAKGEYLLVLPDDWYIEELVAVGSEQLPCKAKPWRVTFNAARFLQHEEARRQGETRMLHFISPVHPLCQQIETRFRLQLEKGGLAIFHVRDCLSKHVVLAEITVRAKSARIIAQKIISLDLADFKEIEFSLLDNFTPIDKLVPLPDKQKWQQLEKILTDKSKAYISALQTAYQCHIQSFLQEQQQLSRLATDAHRDQLEARNSWLKDFWIVDTEAVHYQIVALLVGDGM